MNAVQRKTRRRQMLSNPRVQLRIILTFTLLAVLYAGTNYYVAKSALWSFSAEVQQLPLSQSNRADVDLIVEQQQTTLNLQLGLFTVLIVSMLSLSGLFMSHRLGGPIYQLKTYLRQMSNGDGTPRRIHFRKDDFFHDLAEAFNRFQSAHDILPADDEASGGGKDRQPSA